MNSLRRVICPPNPKCQVAVFAIFFFLTGIDQLGAQVLDLPTNGSAVNIGDLDVPGNQITVEALIYMEKNTPEGNIVSKHLNPNNVNYLLRPLTFELTTYLNGNNGPTHFLQMANPFKLDLNKWYHVAGTYDGKSVKYYVNGCLVIEAPFTGNLFQSNYLTAIGNRSPCECEQFSGKIDEVRIWKVARTQQEIAASMLSLPKPGSQPGLLAYYKFDGNYTNSQGNALWNGRKVGSPVFSSGEASVQSFEVTGLQANNADCEKVNNGDITILANRPDAVYSIDAVYYQKANQFSGLKTGNYTVYAKDQEGCLLKNVVTVGNNHNLVPLDLHVSLCREGSFMGHSAAGTYTDTLPATGSCDTLRTLYLTGNLQSVVSVNRIICNGESYGGHHVTGKYTDTLVAANGCDSIQTLDLTVLSAPHPDLGNNRAICKGDSINLFPGKYNSYLWQDGTLQDHFTVTCAGVYSVKVANACGTRQQQLTITDGVCGLFFPNAFTPNGDGANDEFRPSAFNLANFQWKIFNRMGQLVFETKENRKGWDGRMNGKLQSAGVYVWTCTYTKNNKVEIQKGTMLLIR
ncbi:MAG: LamG-like jellyroll fold domain-containing protein [Bacteroidota bacterium]